MCEVHKKRGDILKDCIKIKAQEMSIGPTGSKRYCMVIKPTFDVSGRTIMKKGGSFYAFFNEETGFWDTNEQNLYEMIDKKLYSYRDAHYKRNDNGDYVYGDGYKHVVCNVLSDSDTKQLIEFSNWFSKLPPNYNFIPLDSSLTFKSDVVKPEDYRSKTLKYDIKPGSTEAYDKLIGTLYSPSEKQKIEWAIGSVLTGDSKNIEKIIAFYGPPGSGKSTVLDLIKMIFDGYWTIFIASELASKSQQFATSVFKDNPLVAIQDDGSLAKIDSPAINEIVSHKDILVNDKNVKRYTIRSNAMLFMATNELIDLHDTNLGLSRRLLDVYPSGAKLPVVEYRTLNEQMKFEIGAIAQHCIDVYRELGKEAYVEYRPNEMIKKVNYLHNFIFDNFERLEENDPIRLSTLYSWYKDYYEESGLGYPPKRLMFKEQVKEYYNEFFEAKYINGATQRNLYSGFKKDKFEYTPDITVKKNEIPQWLKLQQTESILDEELKDCKAQYANEDDKPQHKWDNVKTVLAGIDTSKVHYILMPGNHIVIDFDFKNEKGEKDAKKNLQEAAKWPATYAEFSKSGGGVHLHYIYDGDISLLANRIDNDIEIKKFVGNSSLRRRLTKCNDIPIATISSGLPLKKGGKKMLDFDGYKSEKQLLKGIEDCLAKKHHGATKPEVDFMKKMFDDAYASGMSYDLTPMRPRILAFAMGSTNQKDICIKMVNQMKFRSEDRENVVVDDSDKPIIFYDVEVFPNLFLVNWKKQGPKNKVVRMINPSADEIEDLVKHSRLVGFNCRRYDNHIMYARMMGHNNMALYEQSQKIISGSKNAFFGEAYNLSYTDVYDFASAGNKMSLKKWEIKLGLHHQELGLPWDKPVPKELWPKVAEYCDNDVISTEAVFDHLQGDFTAREILAVLSGLSVNDSTNSHSKRIIFGNNRKPQAEFEYTDLSEMFPGYLFDSGKSTYCGEEVGEGGYVWSKPGIYANVTTFDVASMHPSSIIALNLFGPRYTKRFEELKMARLYIKHNDLGKLTDILDGKLVPFLQAIENGTANYTIKDLSNALKTVINSIYGLTAAKFDNEFKDPRNVDNIVAKRGALFMVDLKNKCLERGMTVVHIKTDSIKIADATEEDRAFIFEFGKEYGYEFEIEAEYERICLINDAVYVANEKGHGWTATGVEFARPYIFKPLFSHEDMEYRDYWETKESHKGDLYLDMNEDLGEDEHDYKFIGKTGAFVPIAPGKGGGQLVIDRGEKYVSAAGAKGYRWMDVEMVTELNKEKDIDPDYYKAQQEASLAKIAEFGDVDQFLDTSATLVNNFVDVPPGSEGPIPYFQSNIQEVKRNG